MLKDQLIERQIETPALAPRRRGHIVELHPAKKIDPKPGRRHINPGGITDLIQERLPKLRRVVVPHQQKPNYQQQNPKTTTTFFNIMPSF